MKKDIYILSAARTAIGSFGGMFKELYPSDLTKHVLKSLITRAGVEASEIDEVIWGNGIPSEFGDWVRTACLKAGFPEKIIASLVNCNCGSGMKAVIFGAQSIKSGETNLVLVGGTETMSSAPYWLHKLRWGQRIGHGQILDSLFGSMTDPISGMLPGATTELLVKEYNIDRLAQDKYALFSHQKALRAMLEGKFKEEIIPVVLKNKKGKIICEKDEGPNARLNIEQLSNLSPSFKEDGTITAGNASSINDASSGLLLASEEKMTALNIEPIGRIVAYASVGVNPDRFGTAPVPATELVLSRANIKISELDLVEINEAFAAQYLACEQLLGLDREKVNVNGGAISLGHPVCASGPRIITTLLYELRRRRLKKGLATMCVGGGMGISFIIETV